MKSNLNGAMQVITNEISHKLGFICIFYEIRLRALEETGPLVKQVSVDMLVAVVIGGTEEIIGICFSQTFIVNIISYRVWSP